MTKKTALKPCPFCGEKNIRLISSGTKLILYWVCCDKCFAVSGAGKTEDEAVVLWNNRAYEKDGDGDAAQN